MCQARVTVWPGGVVSVLLLCLTECCQCRSGQEKPSAYQKDDLWVLSSQPSFQGVSLQPGLKGRSPQGWVLVARSSWHGPNKDGRQAPPPQTPDTSLTCALLAHYVSLLPPAVTEHYACSHGVTQSIASVEAVWVMQSELVVACCYGPL